MKLKEWIRRYRDQKGYSLQDMADLCGISKSFVANLERGVNPSTNKPYSVTLDTAKKIADGTGLSIEELATEVDEINLPDGFSRVNDEEEKILSDYRNLNYSNRQIFRQILTNFLTAQSASGAAIDLAS